MDTCIKVKFLLKKLTSTLPSFQIYFSSKTYFESKCIFQKNYCGKIGIEFRIPSNISDGIKFVTYFDKPSNISEAVKFVTCFDKPSNTSDGVQVVTYFDKPSNISDGVKSLPIFTKASRYRGKTPFSVLARTKNQHFFVTMAVPIKWVIVRIKI